MIKLVAYYGLTAIFLFVIFLAIGLSPIIFVGLPMVIINYKLLQYLKKENPTKYSQLVPWKLNYNMMWKYYTTLNEEDDDMIKQYKQKITQYFHRFILLIIFSFVSTFFIGVFFFR